MTYLYNLDGGGVTESALLLRAASILDIEACQLIAWCIRMPQDLLFSVDISANEAESPVFVGRHCEAIPARNWAAFGEGSDGFTPSSLPDMCHERGLTRSLQHAIFYQEGNAISQSACKNAQVRAVFEKFSEEVAATSGRNEVEKLAKLLESIFGCTYNQEELGGHLVRKEARQSASSSKSSFGFRS